MRYITAIVSFFILFISVCIKGQSTTFEYLLSSPAGEFIFDVVESVDNNIYYSGHFTTPDQPNKQYGLIVMLDSDGKFVDSVHISWLNQSMSIQRLFLKENGEFVTVATIYDSATSYKKSGICFSNMDAALNLSNQKEYSFPSSPKFVNLSVNISPYGNILAGIALREPPSVPKSYFYVFSGNFDSLQARFYPDESRIITHIKHLQNGHYWMLNDLLDQYEVLDSSLNIVAEQHVPEVLTANYGVKWNSDTSFYLLGDQFVPHPPHSLGFIHQFHPTDTTGYIANHWRVSDTVDFPALWNGIDFQNKDSIFIGGTRNMWAGYYNPWPSWFVVLQTDSMLNIRWERFYGGDAYYMMGKVLATHDGGCLVAGTRYDYLNTTEQETDIIILKLNSEGLITGLPENAEINMTEAIVYPNPGNEEIKVRIAAQHKQSVFELFDLNGRLVLNENFTGTDGIVNTTFLPSGTYVYKITNTSGLNETGKWIKQ